MEQCTLRTFLLIMDSTLLCKQNITYPPCYRTWVAQLVMEWLVFHDTSVSDRLFACSQWAKSIRESSTDWVPRGALVCECPFAFHVTEMSTTLYVRKCNFYDYTPRTSISLPVLWVMVRRNSKLTNWGILVTLMVVLVRCTKKKDI